MQCVSHEYILIYMQWIWVEIEDFLLALFFLPVLLPFFLIPPCSREMVLMFLHRHAHFSPTLSKDRGIYKR